MASDQSSESKDKPKTKAKTLNLEKSVIELQEKVEAQEKRIIELERESFSRLANEATQKKLRNYNRDSK